MSIPIFYAVARVVAEAQAEPRIQLLRLRNRRGSHFPLFVSRLDATVVAQEFAGEGFIALPQHLTQVREAMREALAQGLTCRIVAGFAVSATGQAVRTYGHWRMSQLSGGAAMLAWLLGERAEPGCDVDAACRRLFAHTGAGADYWPHLPRINALCETELRAQAQHVLLQFAARTPERPAEASTAGAHIEVLDPFAHESAAAEAFSARRRRRPRRGVRNARGNALR